MAKLCTFCFVLFLFNILSAQAPEKMSYQAVIWKNNGSLVANNKVNIRLQLLQGSESGMVVYEETHSVFTNANGLISLYIGGGIPIKGSLKNIDWTNGPYFLKSETDPNGGFDYSIIGVSQLMSVPYALYAAQSGSNLSAGDGIGIANNKINNKGDINPADDITNATSAGGDLTGIFPNPVVNKIQGLPVSPDKPATGQILQWNGSMWAPSTNVNTTLTSWQITGNTGTNPESNFIGTRDNQPLIFKAGNKTVGKITAEGNNLFWGEGAGLKNTSGFSNTAIGLNALKENTVQINLVAIGTGALSKNGTGSFKPEHAANNTAVGAGALGENGIGSDNTATGRAALLSNSEGDKNSAFGANALYFNKTGMSNSAFGLNALYSNRTGINNSAFGVRTLYSNTEGTFNTASGDQALYFNLSGSYNTASGENALFSNTTGSYNSAYGKSAGSNIKSGSDNTTIGYSADVSSENLNSATALGSFALTNATKKIRIGSAAVLVIEGQVPYMFPSDARFKFNVEDSNVPGLDFINQLRPVTYQFDTRKFDLHLMQNLPDSVQQQRITKQDYTESTAMIQTGFLAQEVEQVCKKLNFNFSGLHVPNNEVDNYGLAYGSFVPLLVKAVQEQQTEIKKLQLVNASLQAQLEAQMALLQKITASLQSAGIGLE